MIYLISHCWACGFTLSSASCVEPHVFHVSNVDIGFGSIDFLRIHNIESVSFTLNWLQELHGRSELPGLRALKKMSKCQDAQWCHDNITPSCCLAGQLRPSPGVWSHEAFRSQMRTSAPAQPTFYWQGTKVLPLSRTLLLIIKLNYTRM